MFNSTIVALLSEARERDLAVSERKDPHRREAAQILRIEKLESALRSARHALHLGPQSAAGAR
ncbi:MAG: hypothetical protein HYX53_02805 [Chloroflexi bacterium]|nr:hypothetical protein [Chloroflexota bacterium]